MNKKLLQNLSFISAVLGILGLSCYFFPFISITKEGVSTGYYTGFNVSFGFSDNVTRMGLNILLIIALVLIVFATLLVFCCYANKRAVLLSAIVFFITGLIILLLPIYAQSLGNIVIGGLSHIGFAWGAIVSTIVLVFAGVLCFIINKKNVDTQTEDETPQQTTEENVEYLNQTAPEEQPTNTEE